jgi:hypothetical protein
MTDLSTLVDSYPSLKIIGSHLELAENLNGQRKTYLLNLEESRYANSEALVLVIPESAPNKEAIIGFQEYLFEEKIGSVSPHLMEDIPDLFILELFINLFATETKKFMTVVMDPSLIIRAVENVFTTVIIRLNWKRFFFLVKRNLIIKDSNLQIFTRDTLVHNNISKCIDRFPSIEYIIDQKNPVPCPEMFRTIGPTIHHDICLGTEIPIGTGYNSRIEYRSTLLSDTYHFVILTKDVCHIGTTSE